VRDARDGQDEETCLEIGAADGSARDFPRSEVTSLTPRTKRHPPSLFRKS